MSDCTCGRDGVPFNDPSCIVHGYWLDLDTAPKDGTEFLSVCVEWKPSQQCPIYLYDFARWRYGYYFTRTGAVPMYWAPLHPMRIGTQKEFPFIDAARAAHAIP